MPAVTTKRPSKPRTPAVAVSRTFATHQELLVDMDAFRQRVSSTPDAAREFLTSAGLLTNDGRTRQLIRG